MKTIRDIEYVQGVKILMRVDFNVPMLDGAVGDDFRIRASLPTIEYLKGKSAVVILISHLESIDGGIPSLQPIAEHLKKLGQDIVFIKDFKKARDIIEATYTENKSAIFLLENIRIFEGEKNNDTTFAEELASLGDIYVNEAFPVSHREHASIVGVPKFLPSYIGFQFEKEVTHLSKAFTPAHPFLFILGGAKFSTKLPLIERFTSLADSIFIGGALANDALRAKGYEVGDSIVSKGNIDISELVNKPEIFLPVDVVLKDHSQKNVNDVKEHDQILDAGSKSVELIREKIQSARFILWNGTLGLCEDGYVEATETIARMITDATQKGNVESIVGGGDTLASLANLGIEDKFTFVSSGGGAMLDFLAKGTLPGIEAVKTSKA